MLPVPGRERATALLVNLVTFAWLRAFLIHPIIRFLIMRFAWIYRACIIFYFFAVHLDIDLVREIPRPEVGGRAFYYLTAGAALDLVLTLVPTLIPKDGIYPDTMDKFIPIVRKVFRLEFDGDIDLYTGRELVVLIHVLVSVTSVTSVLL